MKIDRMDYGSDIFNGSDIFSHKPTGYSYCVVPGKAGGIVPGKAGGVYAGEYPVWEWDREARMRQLRLYLDFGINFFLDLTEDGEMPPYGQFLPRNVRRHSFPIPNGGTPKDVAGVAELFRWIRQYSDSNPDMVMYIHCVGGVGRTGMIVACYLIYFQGMGYEDAVSEMRRRFAYHGRSAWMSAPETQSQADFIKDFAETYRQYL